MGNKLIKYFQLFFFLLLVNQYVDAQVLVEPIGLKNVIHSSKNNTRNESQPLANTINYHSIFIDDFSFSNNSLDPSKWEVHTGVVVNNSLAKNPPSYNFVTFDGLDTSGTPYNFQNQFATGKRDSLVSKPINLSRYKYDKSLNFSFYYQNGGNADMADSTDGDSLALYFYGVDGKWYSITKFTSAKQDSLFNFKSFNIKDSIFIHQNFRFKFKSIGKLSGNWDNWHLDYIRLKSDLRYANVAANLRFKNSKFASENIYLADYDKDVDTLYFSFNLKRIGKSIPNDTLKLFFIDDSLNTVNILSVDTLEFNKSQHYEFIVSNSFYGKRKNSEIEDGKNFSFNFICNDTLNWIIDNLQIQPSIKSGKKYFLNDFTFSTISPSLLKNYGAIPSEQFIGFEAKELKDSIAIKVSLPTQAGFKKIDFITQVLLNNKVVDSTLIDFNSPLLNPYPNLIKSYRTIDKSTFQINADSNVVNFRAKISALPNTQSDKFELNNTIQNQTFIHNFYAYDDGSPEWGFSINQAAGRLMNKYTLNKADTITGVDIAWVKNTTNVEGATFKLMVMRDLDSAVIKSQKSLVYPNLSKSNFVHYDFDSSYILQAGDFYVGFEQNTAAKLSVGYDVNTDFQKNIYYAVSYKPNSASYNWQNPTKYPGSLMIRPIFKRASSAIKNGRKTNGNRVSIDVFPNPNTGVLNFDQNDVKVEAIFDIYGKEIPFQNVQISPTQTQINGLKPGLYILKLNYEGEQYFNKIYIQ